MHKKLCFTIVTLCLLLFPFADKTYAHNTLQGCQQQNISKECLILALEKGIPTSDEGLSSKQTDLRLQALMYLGAHYTEKSDLEKADLYKARAISLVQQMNAHHSYKHRKIQWIQDALNTNTVFPPKYDTKRQSDEALIQKCYASMEHYPATPLTCEGIDAQSQIQIAIRFGAFDKALLLAQKHQMPNVLRDALNKIILYNKTLVVSGTEVATTEAKRTALLKTLTLLDRLDSESAPYFLPILQAFLEMKDLESAEKIRLHFPQIEQNPKLVQAYIGYTSAQKDYAGLEKWIRKSIKISPVYAADTIDPRFGIPVMTERSFNFLYLRQLVPHTDPENLLKIGLELGAHKREAVLDILTEIVKKKGPEYLQTKANTLCAGKNHTVYDCLADELKPSPHLKDILLGEPVKDIHGYFALAHLDALANKTGSSAGYLSLIEKGSKEAATIYRREFERVLLRAALAQGCRTADIRTPYVQSVQKVYSSFSLFDLKKTSMSKWDSLEADCWIEMEKPFNFIQQRLNTATERDAVELLLQKLNRSHLRNGLEKFKVLDLAMQKYPALADNYMDMISAYDFEDNVYPDGVKQSLFNFFKNRSAAGPPLKRYARCLAFYAEGDLPPTPECVLKKAHKFLRKREFAELFNLFQSMPRNWQRALFNNFFKNSAEVETVHIPFRYFEKLSMECLPDTPAAHEAAILYILKQEATMLDTLEPFRKTASTVVF